MQYSRRELKSAIESEAARFNDLQDFVGQSFEGLAQMLGMGSDREAARLIDPVLNADGFSVRTALLEGIGYSLWKKANLKNASWQMLSEAVIQINDAIVSLRDPNPGSGPAYYRVQLNKGE